MSEGKTRTQQRQTRLFSQRKPPLSTLSPIQNPPIVIQIRSPPPTIPVSTLNETCDHIILHSSGRDSVSPSCSKNSHQVNNNNNNNNSKNNRNSIVSNNFDQTTVSTTINPHKIHVLTSQASLFTESRASNCPISCTNKISQQNNNNNNKNTQNFSNFNDKVFSSMNSRNTPQAQAGQIPNVRATKRRFNCITNRNTHRNYQDLITPSVTTNYNDPDLSSFAPTPSSDKRSSVLYRNHNHFQQSQVLQQKQQRAKSYQANNERTKNKQLFCLERNHFVESNENQHIQLGQLLDPDIHNFQIPTKIWQTLPNRSDQATILRNHNNLRASLNDKDINSCENGEITSYYNPDNSTNYISNCHNQNGSISDFDNSIQNTFESKLGCQTQQQQQQQESHFSEQFQHPILDYINSVQQYNEYNNQQEPEEQTDPQQQDASNFQDCTVIRTWQDASIHAQDLSQTNMNLTSANILEIDDLYSLHSGSQSSNENSPKFNQIEEERGGVENLNDIQRENSNQIESLHGSPAISHPQFQVNGEMVAVVANVQDQSIQLSKKVQPTIVSDLKSVSISSKEQQQQQQYQDQPSIEERQSGVAAVIETINHENNLQTNQNSTLSSACKICLDSECTSETGSMIEPCKCRGTLRNVHEECLKTWIISSNPNILEAKCEVCMYVYEQVITFDKECSCWNAGREGTAKILCVLLINFIIIAVIAAIVFLTREIINVSNQDTSKNSENNSGINSGSSSNNPNESIASSDDASFANFSQLVALISICFIILVVLIVLSYHACKQACFIDSIKEWKIKQCIVLQPQPLSRQSSNARSSIKNNNHSHRELQQFNQQQFISGMNNSQQNQMYNNNNATSIRNHLSNRNTQLVINPNEKNNINPLEEQQAAVAAVAASLSFQQTVADLFNQKQRNSVPVMIGSHSIVFNAKKQQRYVEVITKKRQLIMKSSATAAIAAMALAPYESNVHIKHPSTIVQQQQHMRNNTTSNLFVQPTHPLGFYNFEYIPMNPSFFDGTSQNHRKPTHHNITPHHETASATAVAAATITAIPPPIVAIEAAPRKQIINTEIPNMNIL